VTALGSPNEERRATALGSPAARLLGFAGLAAFAAAHWVSLVEGPPAGRVVLAVTAIVAGAVVLVAIGRARLPRLASGALAGLTALAATALALAAVGLSLALLWPAGWDELGANIDRGLTGLAGDVDYPYRGANEWSRLAILAAAPLALGLAAALAFWPAQGRAASRLRLGGLVTIVALYATAVAVHAPGAPLLQGLVLLALIAAWLWLPVLRRGELLLAAGLVAIAGAIAIPAAARIDGSEPWIDYSNWTWSNEQGVGYRWNHSYGPLDWPRDGTTMFAVESDEPHYWKAIVLDRFDGHRWERSESGDAGSIALPRTVNQAPDLDVGKPEWVERVEVTVGSLRSDFVIAPGMPHALDGLGSVPTRAPDGTARTQDEPLSEGDTYSVTAYVPDPSDEELRAAEGAYNVQLAPYTEVAVPGAPTIENAGPSALRPAELVQVPLRGYGAPGASVRRAFDDSPYAATYDLARGLAAGQPTTFDAVDRIQDYLSQTYAYSENPPPSDFPLASFLFEDRIGYCQQFSGAMALMLRMVGIPTRVVSGFAPGSPDLDQDRVFQVEDFDAHSWVEVYFNDIGWVTFDPTPAAAPATSELVIAADGTGSRGRIPFPEVQGGGNSNGPRGGGGGGGSSGGSGPWVLGAIVLGTFALAAAAIGARAAWFRRLQPRLAAEAQVRELRPGLRRLGWPVRDGETLLGLEWRLRRAGKSAAAGYLAGLRRGRFAADEAAPPTLASRRALRRELTRARGLGGRLRGLFALPPGGPRRSAGA
jgi:protein-glutamine gamma-glutamyltransferase